MVRRVFWFAVAGVAMFVYVKVRGYLKQATPQAMKPGFRVGRGRQ